MIAVCFADIPHETEIAPRLYNGMPVPFCNDKAFRVTSDMIIE
jgi:hypothetical protein